MTDAPRIADAARRPRRRRLAVAGWLVLCIGLSISAWVFHFAEEDTSDVIAYVVVDGQSYPVSTRDSKLYRHNLERFGGKMAVFADDVNRWLGSLMHGRKLAIVIGLTSLAVASCCFRASRKR